MHHSACDSLLQHTWTTADATIQLHSTSLGSLFLSCYALPCVCASLLIENNMLQAERWLLQYAIHIVKHEESNLASQGG